MTQGGHSLEHLPAHLTLMLRVFGSDDSPEFVDKVNATIKPLISVVYVAEFATAEHNLTQWHSMP